MSVKDFDKDFELFIYKSFTFNVAGIIENLLNKIKFLEDELKNEREGFK